METWEFLAMSPQTHPRTDPRIAQETTLEGDHDWTLRLQTGVGAIRNLGPFETLPRL